jgi:hypothetical protein
MYVCIKAKCSFAIEFDGSKTSPRKKSTLSSQAEPFIAIFPLQPGLALCQYFDAIFRDQ